MAMYARFIPGQAPKQHDAPEAREAPAVANAASYSRHVPGALANDPLDSTSQTVELPKIQRFDDEPGPPTPKRKRDDERPAESSKKAKKGRDKKAKTTNHTEEPEDATDDDKLGEDVNMQSNEHAASPQEKREKPEKEKEKKKKKRKDTPAPALEEEALEEDQRHKAVLERKEKSLKFAEVVREKKASGSTEQPEQPEQPEELLQALPHGLEPLPQPEPAPRSTEKPSYDTLPPWLSAPIRVSTETRASFTDLGILPRAARILQEKGFAEAFAVQTAAVPLLLPTSEERPGDILISAATGSGKTLAYALPVTRDISSNSVVTRLRALVVLPTRELVKQAQEVFEVCARAYEGEDRKRVRVGAAIGSQSLSWEQDSLVGSETRYDPEAYRQLEGQLDDSSNDNDETSRSRCSRLGQWQGQVLDYYSKVDVLICTPGRLVEHMQQTPGFTLSHVRWLVVDEADKLLSQSFQGWLDVVLESFRSSSGGGGGGSKDSDKKSQFGARDFPDMPYEGVRKVILSATLTRDLSLLSQLALRRPRLIVLEGSGGGGDPNENGVAEHALPGELSEFAVRVHDANLKPLYLLDLLRLHIPASDSDSASDPDSDSDSDSDTSSDSDSDSSSDDTSSSAKQSQKKKKKKKKKEKEKKTSLPMALIFTKSNESALRLSRLLSLLDASLPAALATLTSNTPTSLRRRTLSQFAKRAPNSPLRLVIASDLVARGIDIPGLANVVNYDLPPSVAGYVHRVGRTARAGRRGSAWTLVADGESGWFWGKIAKGAEVRRARAVERVRVEEMAEERVEEYEAALEKLGREVLGK